MKILTIIESPLREASFSNTLGNSLIEKIKTEDTEIKVTIRDLTKFPLPHLQVTHVEAFF